MTYVALGVKVWDENLDIFPQNMLWHLMRICLLESVLTLLHSERPKLYAILAFPSAIGLMRSKYKFPYLNLLPTYNEPVWSNCHHLLPMGCDVKLSTENSVDSVPIVKNDTSGTDGEPSCCLS